MAASLLGRLVVERQQQTDRAIVQPSREALLKRVRGEYLEMPGLCLTLPQAARFLGMKFEEARWVLSELVRRHFLMEGPDGFRRREG